MKRILLACLALGLSFTSCKDKEIEKHLKEVESLQSTVDNIEERLKAVKDDSNGIIIAIVRDDLLTIKKHYIGPDTTNLALGSMLSNYKGIRKVFGRTAKEKKKIMNAIPEEREQLKNLHHDISNGANNREDYPSFVMKEKNNVAQLDTMSLLFERSVNETREIFHTLKPKVDSLISTLEF